MSRVVPAPGRLWKPPLDLDIQGDGDGRATGQCFERQPLLGAVMQIALDPAAGGIADGHDPRREAASSACACALMIAVPSQGHGNVVNSGAVMSPVRAVGSVRRCRR